MSLLKNWGNDDFLTLEKGVLVAEHGLAETGFFSDEGLANLIDNHPEDQLTIATMGSDPTTFDWIEGDRNGASGAELVELLKQGRVWMSLRNVLDHHPKIKEVVDSIYDELERKSPGFLAQDRSANLLLSSSTAMVPYHIDIPVNMLWHIRGRKRAWVYPHFDFRFASQSVVEKVCAGEMSEDIPYDPDFDKYALVFDAEPGQLITWPQLAPHRVQNQSGLCVSLSTEHKNPRARRRISIFEANYVLRSTLGMFYRTSDVDSWSGFAKEVFSRTRRLLQRVVGKKKEQFVYTKSFLVDSTAPDGIRMLDVEAVLPTELT